MLLILVLVVVFLLILRFRVKDRVMCTVEVVGFSDNVVGTVVADSVPVNPVQSQNPFNVLVDGQVPEVSPRKTRAAAEGVAVLINQLKPKGKGGGKKKGKGGQKGGASPVV
ncbi:hypothetical protein V6N12_024333 [Hibiscus sabdariffa]|uniref:Uncharacterized protein n=1 Tax=Hibiscus sabdariffa TaxID=183260 RepID=A0ABR2G089_9ROSI